MMRTAERFFFEEMGIEMPKSKVPTSWFNENNLPQLFECSCCGTIATLESCKPSLYKAVPKEFISSNSSKYV